MEEHLLNLHSNSCVHWHSTEKRDTYPLFACMVPPLEKQNQFLPHHLIPAAIKNSVFTFPLIKGANTAHWTRSLCWFTTYPQTSMVNHGLSLWVLPTPSEELNLFLVSTFKNASRYNYSRSSWLSTVSVFTFSLKTLSTFFLLPHHQIYRDLYFCIALCNSCSTSPVTVSLAWLDFVALDKSTW